VLVQAALFGGGHGYEGWQRMVIIAAMGLLLGSVAAWRQSLRPGMMMHAGQDIAAGLLNKVSNLKLGRFRFCSDSSIATRLGL
jgi:membrane protease YdiL (CAAX protease family)